MTRTACAVVVAALAIVVPAPAAFAKTCNATDTIAGPGDVTPADGLVLCSGTYVIGGTLTLQAGRDLFIGDGQTVEIHAQAVKLYGRIRADGAGYGGGSGGNGGGGYGGTAKAGDPGSGPGAGGGAAAWSVGGVQGGSGGGGGGHVTAGGKGGAGTGGGTPGTAGAASTASPLGSGGGGASTNSNGDPGGGGGDGGGTVTIVTKDFTSSPDTSHPVEANLEAGGAAGHQAASGGAGGGGGSGGTVVITATEQFYAGAPTGGGPAVDVSGGPGADGSDDSDFNGDRDGGGGGGGAGGVIKISRPMGCTTVAHSVAGGSGGTKATGANNGVSGGDGTYACTVLNSKPVIASVTATPATLNQGAQTTVTVNISGGATGVTAGNPYGRLLKYEFDCDGDGTYEVGPLPSNTTTCAMLESGTRTVGARVSDWNSIAFDVPSGASLPAGVTPGHYDIGTFAYGDTVTGSASVTVNDVAPTVTLLAGGSGIEGSPESFTATATDSPGDEAAGFTIAWAFGDGATASGGLTQSHTYTDNGHYTAQVTVTDQGRKTTTKTIDVTVTNAAPEVTLPPVSGSPAAGTTLIFAPTATDPGATDEAAGFVYDFTVTGPDATTLQIARTANNGSGATVSDTPSTPGDYQVTVVATDKDGAPSAPATIKFTVAEAAPPTIELTASGGGQVPESGDPLAVVASWSDPNTTQNARPFTYRWDFGDGTPPQTGTTTAVGFTSAAANHQYKNSGSFTLSFQVTDSVGRSATKTLPVTVTNVAPTVTLSATPTSADEMQTFTFHASASDPSPEDTTAGFDYRFVWGDGSPDVDIPAGQGAPFTQTHVFHEGGTYVVRLTATDKDHGAGDATASVTVKNVAPTLVLTGPGSGNEGDTLTYAAQVTSVSPDDAQAGYLVTWEFGDGTPTVTGAGPEAHEFTDPGSYTVTVTAKDQDGLTDQKTLPVTIANVAPSVSLGDDRTGVRRQPVVFSAQVVDPGPHDTFTYAWTFGDGQTATAKAPTHAYAALGDYDVSLVVTDRDGGVGQATGKVHIVDLPAVASGVTLSPLNPYPLDDLRLAYTYLDGDGDRESGTTIVWKADDVVQPQFANEELVPATATRRGQAWKAEVTPNDGLTAGATVVSNTVVIGDHPPTATGLVITPASPRHGDSLTATYVFADEDADLEDGTLFEWTRNNDDATDFSNQRTVPGPLKKGDTWTVTVTPRDGLLSGAAVQSAAVQVLNTPPVFTSLPDQAVPAVGLSTSVSLSAEATDADGDALTFTWSVDGTTIGQGPNVTHQFPTGTTEVDCIVSDGSDTTSGQVTVAVGDVPPAVRVGADQRVDPGEPIVHAVAIDPLSRPLTYLWEVESAPVDPPPVLLTPNAPDTGFYARAAGDYRLKVTVSNGVETASAETLVTVLDLPPSAAVSPPRPTSHVGDLLTLSGGGSADPNGDALTFSWERLSGPQVTFPNGTTDTILKLIPQAPGLLRLRLTVTAGALSADAVEEVVVSSPAPFAPLADAGPDQRVQGGETVRLDGSASASLDADPLTYLWTVLSGPALVLSDATSATPTFVAPDQGESLIELTVTAGDLSSTDTVLVTAVPGTDQRPVAVIAPPPTNPQIFQPVTFDGSGSSDPDGTALTFRWQQLAGPHVVLVGDTTPQVSFVTTTSGTVVLQLVVSDGELDSLPATAQVTVGTGEDVPPVAVASAPSSGFAGHAVQLDGSQSHDPDGGTLTYAWQQTAGPATTLTGASLAQASFVPPAAGTYTFQLIVDDGELPSAPATVSIDVVKHDPPVAVISVPSEAYVDLAVVADGSKSAAPDATSLTFHWTIVDHPELALSGDDTPHPSFVPQQNGKYVLQLVVNDGTFDSAPATKTIDVHHLPTARGGCSEPGSLGLAALLGLFALAFRRRRTT